MLIAGRRQGADFSPLAEPVARFCRVVLIGRDADRLAEVGGDVPCEKQDQWRRRLPRRMAETGDRVLLSPACASFDMFRDYQDRGDQFRHQVEVL